MSSFDGSDPATSRIQAISSTGFTAFVQEEQSLDRETNHTTKSLAYLALDGSAGSLEGSIYQPASIDIAEYGSAFVNH